MSKEELSPEFIKFARFTTMGILDASNIKAVVSFTKDCEDRNLLKHIGNSVILGYNSDNRENYERVINALQGNPDYRAMCANP